MGLLKLTEEQYAFRRKTDFKEYSQSSKSVNQVYLKIQINILMAYFFIIGVIWGFISFIDYAGASDLLKVPVSIIGIILIFSSIIVLIKSVYATIKIKSEYMADTRNLVKPR
jgi:hypothetical protein